MVLHPRADPSVPLRPVFSLPLLPLAVVVLVRVAVQASSVLLRLWRRQGSCGGGVCTVVGWRSEA